MGLVTPGAPEQLITELTKHFPIQVFVELGTYKGDTALWASRIFQKVLTVEASDIFHKQAQSRILVTKNLQVLFGDSRRVLPGICEQLEEPAYCLSFRIESCARHRNDSAIPTTRRLSV